MKRNSRTPFYELMCNVEEDCTLAVFFNKVIRELDIVKILFAPRTFEDVNEENKEHFSSFYQSCLWELWFHHTLSRLHKWDNTLNEYFSEYESKWKFYACSKRIESINEYGGEESDYNSDGSIKTLNLTEDDLRYHTIIGDMIMEDCKDIVQDTQYTDLQYMILSLNIHAKVSISDVFKECFGKELTMYKQDEDGRMIPMSFSDKALDKAINENEAESMGACITIICEFVQRIIGKIRKLNKFNDNTDELFQIHEDVKKILSFDLQNVSFFKEIYNEYKE